MIFRMVDKIKIIVFLFLVSFTVASANKLYIRVNQVGFLPEDVKTAIVMSKTKLYNLTFTVNKLSGTKQKYKSLAKLKKLTSGKFNYIYELNFSKVKSPGTYYLMINGQKSYPFKIGKWIYNEVVDSLLQFFKVQRCGYTNPLLHKVCHVSDATKLFIDGKEIKEQFDVTGGWHDAGDYVKFLNTTAFSTYMLLFAYDFDPVKFGFDRDRDGVPDVLAEAKVGVDWLLRAVYKKYRLITQVQDLRDHDVGWRMPENDPLTFDRPAFVGIGKNLIGIYTATMALASRIWRFKFNYDEYADKCLTAAENIFSVRNEVPDIDSTGTGMYIDRKYKGKLALGAVELFMTNRQRNLLEEAKKYAAEAGSDYWWSWGDINSLAHYRLARLDTSYARFIKANLEHFLNTSKKHPFEEGADYSWGTNVTLLGVTLQNILWKELTGNNSFDELAIKQRDYILGRNPWGISFISKIGRVYSKNLHHQVAQLNGGYLPGGFAAGPVKNIVYEQSGLEIPKYDRFSMFQADSVVYFDTKNDYLSNEPTIVGNATAVFVMGYFSNFGR